YSVVYDRRLRGGITDILPARAHPAKSVSTFQGEPHWNFYLKPVTALLVILVAVAIREAWERRFAPTITRT
ncbi:hypothetical protein, partial [Nocardia seriolae]|uniref:hypothetical protein n=1 Tax=Nocardia seriolae TaxID=37332 RepID=UPI001C629163